ncbi:hypothetical protein, partial [Janthinobacterium sp. Ant5-2-1]|uniref:hypothetical protein n=1 Tax=Janthinobacterium sp. Ant5-2-1 TaxID=1755239 RepID=UPI000A4C43D5
IGLGTLAAGILGIAGLAAGGGGGSSSNSSVRVQEQAQALDLINITLKNGNMSSFPVSGYNAAGITGVSADNVNFINDALNTNAAGNVPLRTAAEIQTIVNISNAIFFGADGIPNGGVSLTAAQYSAIGISGLSNVEVSLLNSIIDRLSVGDVKTIVDIQALANAIHAISTGLNGGVTATPEQFNILGIHGVTTNNLDAIYAGLAESSKNGTAIGTISELSTIVKNIVDAFIAIGIAAETNNPTIILDASIYSAAGIRGVSVENVGAINSALASSTVGAPAVNSLAGIQTLVDAYNAVLSGAGGTIKGNLQATALQFATIGVTGLNFESATLLDSIIDALPKGAADTIPKIQVLADAVNAIFSGAAGGNGPTLAQLNALGITGVTEANLAAVLAAIHNTPDDGSAVDTQGELQAIVINVVTAINAISTAAQANNTASLTEAVYAMAGVNGVTSNNVAFINSVLDGSNIGSDATNTPAGIQTIVDASNAILLGADGITNGNAQATIEQYNA